MHYRPKCSLLLIFIPLLCLCLSVAPASAQGLLINGNRTISGTLNVCADAGSTDAYACNLVPAITAYVTGGSYTFKANTANTGAATLALNGLAVKTIKKQLNVDLATNDILAGRYVTIVYDGTNFQCQDGCDGNSISGSGTVTSIATTAPLTGGTITSSGTLACATCTTSAAALTNNQLLFGAGAQAMAVGNLTGDVTTAGAKATTLANIPSAVPMAGSLLATAIAAPATPAAGKGSIYVDSTSKNLAIKDDAGIVKHGVQTYTCTNQFARSSNDAGLITCATVDLTADVTNNLPVSKLNSGTGASGATFWAGDGTWKAPAGGGDALVGNPLSQFASTTSAQLASVISDETGTGALVYATNPVLVAPTLGAALATSINKVALTAPASSATLTIADGKTLTASNTLILTGTDTSSIAFGTGGTVAYAANNLSVFAATTSAQLAGVLSDETGTGGGFVRATSPSITSPAILTSLVVPLAAGAVPTADGDIRFDTTKHTMVWGTDGIATVAGVGMLFSGSGGSTNSAAAGAGTYTDHTPTFTLPANLLRQNRQLRVCATITITTVNGTVPSYQIRLKLGTTVVYTMLPDSPTVNSIAVASTMCFHVHAEAAPGAAAAVRTSTVTAFVFCCATANNNTAQPVNLATNGSLVGTIGTNWGSNISGNTMTLSDLTVETLN